MVGKLTLAIDLIHLYPATAALNNHFINMRLLLIVPLSLLLQFFDELLLVDEGSLAFYLDRR